MNTEKQSGVAPAPMSRRLRGIRTPQQREIDKRNAEIYQRFEKDYKEGAERMPIYRELAMVYGLSVPQISLICRTARKEAAND